jgi:hypothetical protein
MREEISLIEGLDRGLERQDRLDVQIARLEAVLGTDNLVEPNENQDGDHTG